MIAAQDSAWLAELTLPQLQQELALAASQLASVHLAEARDGWPAQCHECAMTSRDGLLHILHREGCRAGRVARVLYLLADKLHSLNPGKETAQQDSEGGAARETRPHPVPFLVAETAAETDAPGRYGEPWAIDNAGLVYDAAGNTILDPTGCELAEPDDVRALHRAMLCVNFCNGVATEDLERVGGAM